MHVTLTEAALVFPDAAPVLAYLESLMAWQTLSGGEQAHGRAALETVLGERFRTGPWRVSKRVALLEAVRQE